MEGNVNGGLPNDQFLLGYLLGELSEQESVELEGQYFANSDTFEHLCALEDELIDRYVCGELSMRDRERFEKRFLSSPKQLQKIEFARSFFQYVAKAPPHRERTWRGITQWRFALPKPAILVPAALALAAAVGSGSWWLWRMQSPTRTGGLQTQADRTRPAAAGGEQPALTRQQGPSTSGQQSKGLVVALLLTTDLTRGDARQTTLAIPSNSSWVELTANLEPDTYKSYRCELQTVDGHLIWSQEAAEARSGTSGKSVLVRIPAERFASRDYVFTLSGRTAAGKFEVVGEYAFRAVRR
jgi:hypothetical protein